ncbi:MAG: hypothetical protein QOI01_1852 [Mycobacterium sp.]|nr:hypothetical protein [Mycobacterium sp.]
MTVDDDIDELYAVAPESFTALRTELAAAAKKRGDVQAAKSIAAARRPTTAAWVVNVLVRSDVNARDRLNEVTEGLRAAHAAMNGARIRELSAIQRRLIDELVRTGFAATGLSSPSAALRDDVVGTLQAAIADPDVAARLGRLAKAERWSGFGDFGSVSTVGAAPTTTRRAKRGRPEKSADHRPAQAAARERVVAARREAERAERAHAGAIGALSERTATLATARRRYEKLLETLSAAEGELNTADAEHADAEQAARAASDRLDAAKSALAEAESALEALT